MSNTPLGTPTLTRKDPPPPSSAGPRHRTATACASCRIHKTKCDGAMPCQMCVSRSCLCKYEKHRRQRHYSRLLQSPNYLELLEDQNQRLSRAVVAMHKRLVDAHAWEGGEIDAITLGSTSVHHIIDAVERNGTPSDSHCSSPVPTRTPRPSRDTTASSNESWTNDSLTHPDQAPSAAEFVQQYANFLQQSSVLNNKTAEKISSRNPFGTQQMGMQMTTEPETMEEWINAFTSLDSTHFTEEESIDPLSQSAVLDAASVMMGYTSDPRAQYHQAMAAHTNKGVERAFQESMDMGRMQRLKELVDG